MTKRKSGAPRARRGETLVEVLVALLIVVLATLLLSSMVTASAGINFTARQKDERFYAALSKVEAMDSVVEVTGAPAQEVIITNNADPADETKIEVDVYTSDNLAMYKRSEP